MAKPHARHSPFRKLLPTGKDELARATPIEGSSTLTSISIMSYAPTPAPTTTFAVAPSSDNKLFKQFIKASLKPQVPGQIEIDPKSCK